MTLLLDELRNIHLLYGLLSVDYVQYNPVTEYEMNHVQSISKMNCWHYITCMYIRMQFSLSIFTYA